MIHAEDEFKEISHRQMIADFAHGGKMGETITEEVTHWLRYLHVESIWEEAKTIQLIAGKLISDLDGTPEQLDFFQKKYNLSLYGWEFTENRVAVLSGLRLTVQ